MVKICLLFKNKTRSLLVMKRKLISFDAFKKIQETSITNIQAELIACEDLIAQNLDYDDVKLLSFGESDVTYETPDGSYVHATYTVRDNDVTFDNVQELIIETESERIESKSKISKMIDSILENKEVEATDLFNEYMSMPSIRREMLLGEINTSNYKTFASRPTGKRSKLYHKRQNRSDVAKRIRSRLKTLRKTSPAQKLQLARKRKIARNKLSNTKSLRARVYGRFTKKNMKEWSNLCSNVFEFLNFNDYGISINEAVSDNQGNIVKLVVPTLAKQNNNKNLFSTFKESNEKLLQIRQELNFIHEHQGFVKAMLDLKRFNNVSDNNSLETCLENITGAFPNLIFLSEQELIGKIKETLELANSNNYDDDTCSFMAEAILRTAHSSYSERVSRITKLAGESRDLTVENSRINDPYIEFKACAEKLFESLNQHEEVEYKIFADLYKALHELNMAAASANDEATKIETTELLNKCGAILNNEERPSLEVAEEIATYISDVVEEGSEEEGGDHMGMYGKDAHEDMLGQHPFLKWNAKQSNTAAEMNGPHNGTRGSDGKSVSKELADEIASKGFGSHTDSDTYPNVTNPYLLKTDKATMKGEKGVDVDNGGFGEIENNDTYPSLKNPYSLGGKKMD